MLILKVYYHIKCVLKFLMFKVIYGKKLTCPPNISFRNNFYVEIVGGGKIVIGKSVFFNNGCSLCAMAEITVGDGTIFGENIKVYDHNHIYSDIKVPIKKQGYTYAPVHIGNHCWIGSNVTILKGVTIGDNCVIGAGCVIYKSIPSNTVVICNQNLVMKG